MAAMTISKNQIAALRNAITQKGGVIGGDRGITKALVARGLAVWIDDKYALVTTVGNRAWLTNFAGFKVSKYVPTSEHT
ncbi:MAG: hypothetical protein ACM359_11105 [Bacillota bacterium]